MSEFLTNVLIALYLFMNILVYYVSIKSIWDATHNGFGQFELGFDNTRLIAGVVMTVVSMFISLFGLILFGVVK